MLPPRFLIYYSGLPLLHISPITVYGCIHPYVYSWNENEYIHTPRRRMKFHQNATGNIRGQYQSISPRPSCSENSSNFFCFSNDMRIQRRRKIICTEQARCLPEFSCFTSIHPSKKISFCLVSHKVINFQDRER